MNNDGMSTVDMGKTIELQLVVIKGLRAELTRRDNIPQCDSFYIRYATIWGFCRGEVFKNPEVTTDESEKIMQETADYLDIKAQEICVKYGNEVGRCYPLELLRELMEKRTVLEQINNIENGA